MQLLIADLSWPEGHLALLLQQMLNSGAAMLHDLPNVLNLPFGDAPQALAAALSAELMAQPERGHPSGATENHRHRRHEGASMKTVFRKRRAKCRVLKLSHMSQTCRGRNQSTLTLLRR